MKILTLAALVLTVTPAISQTPLPLASETDLKAAYCMAVYSDQQAMLAGATGPDVPQAIAEASSKAMSQAQSDERRVRLYLVPRMAYLDSTALLAAKRSGEEDTVRATAAAASCAAKCTTMQCVLSCPDSAEATRIKSCVGARFLPF